MGCALGLALFSRFLTWLLRRFAEQTITFIGGLLLGSLMVIWPWRLDDQAQPLLPWDYAVLTGAEPQQGWASLALVAGFLLVVAIERLFRPREE
jgi:putative membrane protein